MCWHGNSRCVNEIPCMESKDYYTVLGVTPAEGLQAIRQAYRSLAKRYHPDYAGQEGHTQFQEIQEAYEVLSDPRKRKEYDARRPMVRPARVVSEPLVPRHTRTPAPEPLVPRTSPVEEFSASPRAAPCRFCHGGRGPFEPPCPFCQEFDPQADDMTHFLLEWLRELRMR
ncbi:J domain-containing protein [Nitrospira sp. BLG_2]|uniref:J domain-containing protein n=1 Tax=Nitrospira sp. BLG_2 TaxID=3397507 RepID=UPI003B9C5836